MLTEEERKERKRIRGRNYYHANKERRNEERKNRYQLNRDEERMKQTIYENKKENQIKRYIRNGGVKVEDATEEDFQRAERWYEKKMLKMKGALMN